MHNKIINLNIVILPISNVIINNYQLIVQALILLVLYHIQIFKFLNVCFLQILTNVWLLIAVSLPHALTWLMATIAPATVDLREMGFPAPVSCSQHSMVSSAGRKT